MIDGIEMDLMRYCKIYDQDQLDRMTIRQYMKLMKAINLQQVDQQYQIHLSAWVNHQVGATENVGSEKKPKYKQVFNKFDDFFDYEKQIAIAKGEKPVEKEKLTAGIDPEFLELIKQANL